jgi:hypothetical protein
MKKLFLCTIAGTICCSSVTLAQNLLLTNPDFDGPPAGSAYFGTPGVYTNVPGWTITVGPNTNSPYAGYASDQGGIGTPNFGYAGGDVTFETTPANRAIVTPGRQYNYSYNARNDGGVLNGALFFIDWYDASGNRISSADLGNNLANTPGANSSPYSLYTGNAVSPIGAAAAGYRFTTYDVDVNNPSSGTAGGIVVDNFSLEAGAILNTTDTDGDTMPDLWETENGFNPNSNADGGASDADSDGSPNTQEYTRLTNPRDSDTDDDTLLDGVETGTGTFVSASNTGTNPKNADSDDDGLSDGNEVTTTLTNPNLKDTDNDGYKDAYEILWGTSPTNAASPAINAVRSIGINFNAVPSDPPTTGSELLPNEAAGHLIFRQTNWNNVDSNAAGDINNVFSPTTGSLVNNAAAITPVQVSWTSPNVFQTTNNLDISTDSKLMYGYLDNSAGSPTTEVNLTDIPYSTYDVVVYYGSGGNQRSGNISSTAAGTTFYYRTQAQYGEVGFSKENYLESTITTNIDDVGSNYTNFCRFINQTSSSFDIKVTRISDNSGIMGLQIIERPNVTVAELKITTVSYAAATGVTFSWNSESGATYTVQKSSNLINWTNIQSSVAATSTSTSYTDATVTGTSSLPVYYRVRKN